MRALLVSLSAALCLCVAGGAQAERRVFIITSDAGGYGVDRCLASGAKCGAAAANAYCRTREFAQATSFSKVDRDDITGAIQSGATGGCKGSACDDLVAIVCTR
jgi:hypothetical protein